MSKKLRLAMLISGSGTTMEAIIKACQSGQLAKIEPVLVIASKRELGGIQKAINAGMNYQNVLVIYPKNYSHPLDFGKAILKECKKRQVDFIGQYGWLVKTPVNIIDAYRNMMANQHP